MIVFRCARCERPVPAPVAADYASVQVIAEDTWRLVSGVTQTFIIAGPFEAVRLLYCAECSADLRVCRCCGCTDETAPRREIHCWIEENLCGACRVERAA